MKRPPLALLILLVASAACGQSVPPARQSKSAGGRAQPSIETEDNRLLATQALDALKLMDNQVIVYRSLADFEAGGKLARVPFANLANDLQAVTNRVEPILSRMTPGKLKAAITNALDSYRDGVAWWEKIDQRRVVSISELASTPTRTSSDLAVLASVPYTVAIHWRQARGYLRRAGQLADSSGN